MSKWRLTTWKKQLRSALKENGEFLKDLQGCTASKAILERPRKDWPGCVWDSGVNFTAWTAEYVYFTSEYDGMETVKYVPRNPP